MPQRFRHRFRRRAANDDDNSAAPVMRRAASNNKAERILPQVHAKQQRLSLRFRYCRWPPNPVPPCPPAALAC